MASEWSIRCSFISQGPVHLRKWEKARQTHGPDVAEFIRYFHTNWIYPIQPLSGIRQIIHTLLSACFHTILHRKLGWLKVSQMKPCLRQSIFLWVPNWVTGEKMWWYIFVRLMTFLRFFFPAVSVKCCERRLYIMRHFYQLKKHMITYLERIIF